jgi:hypothetical protein
VQCASPIVAVDRDDQGDEMRRPLIAAACVAAATTAVLPAAASAKKSLLFDKQFTAVLTGKQTIEWKQPKVYGTRTCFGTSWVEGDGKETIEFKSKRARIVAFRQKSGVYFEYNTRHRGRNYDDGIALTGYIDRSGEYRNGEDAGACGGGEPTTSQGPYKDCGYHPQLWEGSLHDQGDGKLELSVGPRFLQREFTFTDCPIAEPLDVSGGSFRTIYAAFSPKKLMNAKKPLTIWQNWKAIDQTSLPGDGVATAVTEWKLKLVPKN